MFDKEPRLKPFFFGIGAFLIITILVSAYAINLDRNDTGLPNSFAVSLAASFIEDLVFFILIGAVLAYLGMRSPENDAIDSRMRYLFNGAGCDREARKYTLEKILNLGVFCPRLTIRIAYSDDSLANTDGGVIAIKASVTVERVVANMFNDHDFFDHDLPYMISADDLTIDDDKQGELILVNVEDATGGRDCLDFPVKVTSQAMRRVEKINIPKDGEVTFRYKFWIWHKIGEDFLIDSARYTSVMNVNIENECAQAITLAQPGSQPITLDRGGRQSYSVGPVTADETLLFTLQKVGMMPGTKV